jgi:glutamyl-tRNA synthetase
LSDAVVNFIALLGWSPKDESEIFSPAQLIEKFSLENINRSPGRFDIEKCKWVNQQHLLKLSAEEFAATCNSDATPAMLASVQEKVSLLTEVPDAVAFYLDPDYPIANDALDKVKKKPSGRRAPYRTCGNIH